MLGYDNLTQPAEVFVRLLVVVDMVVFRTVDKAYDIRILLNSTRLTQVAQLRLLAVYSRSTFHGAAQLAQCNNGYIQLLCHGFQVARNHTNLLLAAAEVHPLCVHQLQVVDDDELHSVLTN